MVAPRLFSDMLVVVAIAGVAAGGVASDVGVSEPLVLALVGVASCRAHCLGSGLREEYYDCWNTCPLLGKLL
jgi:hypothetical protein